LDCVYEQGAGCTYPLILVNVGSGDSILKVDGPAAFERVSGGGGGGSSGGGSSSGGGGSGGGGGA
jgi:pantothenate kinase